MTWPRRVSSAEYGPGGRARQIIVLGPAGLADEVPAAELAFVVSGLSARRSYTYASRCEANRMATDRGDVIEGAAADPGYHGCNDSRRGPR
jgi:hypothetical protein